MSFKNIFNSISIITATLLLVSSDGYAQSPTPVCLDSYPKLTLEISNWLVMEETRVPTAPATGDLARNRSSISTTHRHGDEHNYASSLEGQAAGFSSIYINNATFVLKAAAPESTGLIRMEFRSRVNNWYNSAEAPLAATNCSGASTCMLYISPVNINPSSKMPFMSSVYGPQFVSGRKQGNISVFTRTGQYIVVMTYSNGVIRYSNMDLKGTAW